MKQSGTRGKVVSVLMVCAIVVTAVCAASRASYADDQMDALLKALVEEGAISQEKADEVKAQAEEAEAKGEPFTLPDWVEKLDIGGDLRLRYQYQDKEGSASRDRGRIRFKLNMEAEIFENLAVGVGLATGGSDPRSTNQTMEDFFSSPDFRLDLAYAKWTPFDCLTIWGGKFKNPLWTPSDLLWDGDIRPEGIAFHVEKKLAEDLEFFFNNGYFVLDEIKSSDDDPFLMAFQPGLKWNITDSVDLAAALTWYQFFDIKGSTPDADISAGTNTTMGGNLIYDYNALSVGTELGVDKPFGGDIVPRAALIGEYVCNVDPDEANNGWLAGFYVGDKKVKKCGQWQAKYAYRRMERDAWLDTFPDSDFYGGATNAQGHEIIFDYGVFDNVTLGVDYYHTQNIQGSHRDEDLIQLDCVIKF